MVGPAGPPVKGPCGPGITVIFPAEFVAPGSPTPVGKITVVIRGGSPVVGGSAAGINTFLRSSLVGTRMTGVDPVCPPPAGGF